MQVHVAIMPEGYLLSTIEKADEDKQQASYDAPPDGVPPALRPQVAKVRSSVVDTPEAVVSALGHLLELARDAHDPDEPPLMGARGCLLGVSDGALGTLHYIVADRGLVVQHHYLADATLSALTLEEEDTRVILHREQEQEAVAAHAFGGTASAVAWTLATLVELRKQAAEDAAEDDDDE